MRDQFGLKPKQQNLMYRTPYPAAYDQLPLPHKYKLPDFTKFSRQGEVSTVEHINRFIIQCGEVAQHDALKVCLFSMSLFGSAFTWFTTLPANSIIYWADLEKQFHQFFYSGIEEMKLTDLTNLRQRNDESVTAFIQRFRDVKNWCFSLILSDQQLAEVAFQGLLPHIKEKYASQEFYSISQMAHRMTGEIKSYEQKRSNFQKKVNFVYCSDASDSDDDQMVGSTEWVQSNKKPISCPFGNKEPEKYGFDITKADKIFDLFLSEGQIMLKPYHKIPADQELKNIKYCK